MVQNSREPSSPHNETNQSPNDSEQTESITAQSEQINVSPLQHKNDPHKISASPSSSPHATTGPASNESSSHHPPLLASSSRFPDALPQSSSTSIDQATSSGNAHQQYDPTAQAIIKFEENLTKNIPQNNQTTRNISNQGKSQHVEAQENNSTQPNSPISLYPADTHTLTPVSPAANNSTENLSQKIGSSENHQKQVSFTDPSTIDQDSTHPVHKALKQEKKAVKIIPPESGIQQPAPVQDSGSHEREEFGVATERPFTPVHRPLSAWCIFAVPECVQIFYISPDGAVQVPEETTFLRLVRLNRSHQLTMNKHDEESSPAEPLAFLHVGDWFYPLIPGCSPVLITAYGTYVFPDLRANQYGAAVALALPQTLTSGEREHFEVLLEYYANVEDTVDRAGVDDVMGLWGSNLSDETLWDRDESRLTIALTATSVMDVVSVKGIVMFMKIISLMIAIGIGFLTEFGIWIIRLLFGRLRAVARRSSQIHDVNPMVRRGILYAKSASDRSVILTAQLMNNLQEAVSNLSTRLTPNLPSAGYMPGFLGNFFQLSAVLGASVYGGMGEVYLTLEDASFALLEAFSEEASKTMEHRYGERYGDLTREAFETAVNMQRVVTTTTKIQTTVTSLALVPMTLERTIKDTIITPKGKASKVFYFDENEEEFLAFSEDYLKRIGFIVDDDEEKAHRGPSPRKHKKNQWSYGSQASTDSNEQPTSQGSIESTMSTSSKRFWSSWKPSNAIVDAQALEAKALSRKDSSDVSTTWYSRPKSSALARRRSSTIYGMRSQTSMASLGETPLAETIRANAESNSENVAFEKREISEGKASTSSHVNVAVRKFSSTIAPSRRQSVFLSARRQSMHVNLAMANAFEKESWDKKMYSIAPLLAVGADVAKRYGKFRRAAISVTKSKIRRRHMERSKEMHLVVVVREVQKQSGGSDNHRYTETSSSESE